MTPSTAAIWAALEGVVDPCSVGAGVPLDIVSMGLVEKVEAGDDGAVVVGLRLTSPGCLMGPLVFEPEIVDAVSAVDGVTGVAFEHGDPLTWTEDAISAEGRRRLAEARHGARVRVPSAGR